MRPIIIMVIALYLSGCPSPIKPLAETQVDVVDASVLTPKIIESVVPKIWFKFDGGSHQLTSEISIEFDTQLNSQFRIEATPPVDDIRFYDWADRLVPCDELRTQSADSTTIDFTLSKPLLPQKSYFFELSFPADSGIGELRFEMLSTGDAESSLPINKKRSRKR